MPDLTLQQSVDQFKEDQERVRKFVNEEGGYVAEDGTPVKSLRDFNVTLEGYEGQALAFRNEAEGFAIDGQNSATSSGNSSTSAAASAAAALAAAEASGNVVFYDTYALANAAVGSLSDLQVVHVFVDETRDSRMTAYRKEGGALVFKVYLDETPKNIYVDSVIGNDANDGLSPLTPKLTLNAASSSSFPGSTIWLARGSQWFNGGTIFDKNYVKLNTYGQGNKPIIDGAQVVLGAWTNDPTYTNLWYIDVTFAAATTGNYTTEKSSAWHPGMWDEAASSRTNESGLIRVLNGDIVAGATVAAANIAALLTIANANAGSFTVHRTGSTNVEPRNDNGTQFRFYINPADATNPNTNGRSVYVVSQAPAANFRGRGTDAKDVVFQRTGNKDLVIGVEIPNNTQMGQFEGCEFLEAAVHGNVVGGAEFKRCIARAASRGDAKRDGGGAYNQYRSFTGAGTSRGFKVYDCEAYGFFQGVYGHGDGSNQLESKTFDVDGLLAVDCTNILARAFVEKNIRARRIIGVNCTAIVDSIGTDDIIEDSVIINPTVIATVRRLKAKITMRNSFVYKKTGRLEICDPFTLGTIAAADYPTAVFENSTVYGAVSDPGNAQRRQQHWTLTNSVMQSYVDSDAFVNGDWLSGDMIATNSYIGLNAIDLETLRAVHAGIASNCYSNRYKNKFQKLITINDLLLYSTTRTASYSGVDNGDGTANLTLNFNDRTYGRYVRIIDAYGAGLHYEGRIVSFGAISSDPIVVAPPPTGAFSNKAYSSAVFNRKIWDSAFSDTATVSFDGTQVRVADATLYCVGMLIYVGKINQNEVDYGPRTITGITGNVLTLNAALPWTVFGDTSAFYNSVDGVTVTGRQPLPTTTIRYGFPIATVTNNSQTNYPYPLLTVNAVEGTSGSSKMNANNDWFVQPAGVVASSNFARRRTNSATYDFGSIFGRQGFVDTGFQVTVGDTLTVEAVAAVPDWEPKLISEPNQSLNGNLAFNSYIGNLGIGYRKRI